MYRFVAYILLCVKSASSITNNADLIWYDANDQPQKYFARQPFPEGLVDTRKIVVNQRLPVLWQVKFAFFDNLDTLLIDGCGVKDIKPNTFKDLKPLTDLSLTFNEIKDIKEGVFNGVQVLNLNLSHNKIATIAATAFDNMPDLEKINLDYNELRHWDGDWFFNCTSLNSISLTHNFLDELPARAFRNLEDRNGINIYLSYNKIERIDSDAFEHSGLFGDLFLDWNDMERVDGYIFEKMQGVKYLNLDGDSLKCLSEKFINGVLNKTERVSIKWNPFKCECFREIVDRANELPVIVEYVVEQSTNC